MQRHKVAMRLRWGRERSMLLFIVTECNNYLMRKQYSTKQRHLFSILSKQHIELSLVKIEHPSMYDIIALRYSKS